MQLSMPTTLNNIGNKIIRLTRHRASIDNIRSTFPSPTGLLIFLAGGFRSTCCFVFFPWHNTMKQSLCEYTIGFICDPRFLLRSFHNFSVEVVSHKTRRLSLRGGRPLFERFMFVNGDGKLPNIHRVHNIYSQRTSRSHLQQPVSADCNDTVR